MPDTVETAAAIRSWMEAFTTRSMQEWWRVARKTGISMPQFGLLRRLYHGGECEVHEIGRHFDVSSAAASQLVDKLVQAGLAARSENPDDRRARQVALTARGRALIENGIAESYRWVDDLAAALGPRGRAAVRAVLPLLVDAEASLPRPQKQGGRDAIRSPR